MHQDLCEILWRSKELLWALQDVDVDVTRLVPAEPGAPCVVTVSADDPQPLACRLGANHVDKRIGGVLVVVGYVGQEHRWVRVVFPRRKRQAACLHFYSDYAGSVRMLQVIDSRIEVLGHYSLAVGDRQGQALHLIDPRLLAGMSFSQRALKGTRH